MVVAYTADAQKEVYVREAGYPNYKALMKVLFLRVSLTQ